MIRPPPSLPRTDTLVPSPPLSHSDRRFVDAAADDVAALQRHGAELDGPVRSVASGNGLQVAAIAVDDLAAVASGGSKTDPFGLQHHDGIAPFAKFERGRSAGKAGTDDAHIRLRFAFAARPPPLVLRVCRIPGIRLPRILPR